MRCSRFVFARGAQGPSPAGADPGVIQTIPKRGYRLITSVNWLDSSRQATAEGKGIRAAGAEAISARLPAQPRRSVLPVWAQGAAFFLIAGAVTFWLFQRTAPRDEAHHHPLIRHRG
ncbi:MAG TPA: hypothetical protein VM182_14655 [Terriglobia bacterium]|nr:hypothetical protein [Terriglobia bacterium]